MPKKAAARPKAAKRTKSVKATASTARTKPPLEEYRRKRDFTRTA